MHFMPIKNKFSKTVLDTDLLYNYMNYYNDVGAVFNDDIISKIYYLYIITCSIKIAITI